MVGRGLGQLRHPDAGSHAVKQGAPRAIGSFVGAVTFASAFGALGAQIFSPSTYGAGSYVLTTLLLLPVLLPATALAAWATRPLFASTRLQGRTRSALALVLSFLTVATGGFVVTWLSCVVALYWRMATSPNLSAPHA